MPDPSQPFVVPSEVASGIDALYLSARGTVPPVLPDELDLHKTVVARTAAPVDALLGEYPVRVLGTNRGLYRYCAELIQSLARIGIPASERLPAVRVNRRACTAFDRTGTDQRAGR